jgi:hypothetical protein
MADASGENRMNIIIQRKSKSIDGIFGVLTLDWNPFTCVTLENLKDALEPGVWPLTFAYSPHFNRIMPLINVPGRTWTWIHWANFPLQLLGCVAVGQTVDGDAIDTSQIEWNQLWIILNTQPGIKVDIRDIPA